ncbi:MAG TPA: DUF2007 domain-containing protein [Ferruginibacter sp.]|nr:DUF2007 domain-containing protein [Ferruginibacter sp.]HMP19875.1 DUF2007 domain-containing protein [Ferruginibacter sp.]
MHTVIVRTFDNYFTANITLTKLQDAGIECYLQDEFTVTIDPILTNALGGIKLVVKKEDETAALELLTAFDETYRKAAACPQCGRHEFVQIAKPGAGNFLTAVFTWIFSNYAIAPNYVYQCGACGYETKQLPSQTFTSHD